MANFHLSAVVIDTDVRWTLKTSAEGDGSVGCNNPKTSTTSSFFRTQAQVPFNADWETGGFTVYLTIDTGYSGTYVSAYINRCNSSGTVQETSAQSNEVEATAGDKTLTIPSKDWSAGAVGDLLELRLDFRNPGHSNYTTVVSTGNSSLDYVSSSVTVNSPPSPIAGASNGVASNAANLKGKGELIGAVDGYDLTTNLISYYKLDEASGYPQDSHGTHHVTSITGTPTYSQTGKIGTSIDVNAVTMGIGDHADFAVLTTEYSAVSAWVYLTSHSDTYGVVYGNTSQVGYYLYGTDGIGEYQLRTLFGTVYSSSNAFNLNTGEWHHFVWVHETDGISFYVDGSLNRKNAQIQEDGDASAWQISNQTFDVHGRVDELAYWKGKALTGADVSTLYNNGNGLAYEDFISAGSQVTGVLTEAEAPPNELIGSTSGVATVSGDLQGTGELQAQTDGLADVSATINGWFDLSGATDGIADVSGDLQGTGELQAQTDGLADVSGDLQGLGELAGQTDGAATVDGFLQVYIPIDGGADGGAEVIGNLLGQGELQTSTGGIAEVNGVLVGRTSVDGQTDGVTTVNGVLTAKGTLAGATDGVSLLTGDLQVALITEPIDGGTDGVAEVNGVLTAKGTLAGESGGTSDLTGVWSAVALITGTTDGVAVVNGEFTTGGELTGTSDGTATLTGTLLAKGSLLATTDGVANVTGTLVGKGALAGASGGVAGVTGIMLSPGQLLATTDGISNVTGTLLAKGALAGASDGVALLTGNLEQHLETGFVDGGADGITTVTGVLTAIGHIAGGCAGVSTITGTFVAGASIVGATEGVSALSGVLYGKGVLQALTEGVSTIDSTLGGKADISGQSVSAADLIGTLFGTGELVGEIEGTSNTEGFIGYPGMLLGATDGVCIVSGSLSATGSIQGTSDGVAEITGIGLTRLGFEKIEGNSFICTSLSEDSSITASLNMTSTIKLTAVLSGVILDDDE